METNLGKEYIDKLKEKFINEEEKKAINKELASIEAKLVAEMEEGNVNAIVVDEFKLTRVTDETFSLTGNAEGQKWDDPDGEWFKWLKENGEGALIKNKDSVHEKTRKAFLKARREDGKNIPEFIKIGFWKHIDVNKTEVKRRALLEDKQSNMILPTFTKMRLQEGGDGQ